MIDAFAKTAKLCKEAGVDGIQIHAVHEGYLLDQFTMKYTNQRTDEYGGSFENRYCFPVKIVKAVKKAVPKRISGFPQKFGCLKDQGLPPKGIARPRVYGSWQRYGRICSVPQNIYRTQVMICSTATTVHMMLGIGLILPDTCWRTVVRKM